MIHGEVTTIKTRVANGEAIYTKRVRHCSIHGAIDLFVCGGGEAWDARHARCNQSDKAHGIGLELPRVIAKAA